MRMWAEEVRNVSVLVAIGVSEEGNREVLAVAEIISQHSRANRVDTPASMEAKVLYDADKQDGLGIDGKNTRIELEQKNQIYVMMIKRQIAQYFVNHQGAGPERNGIAVRLGIFQLGITNRSGTAWFVDDGNFLTQNFLG